MNDILVKHDGPVTRIMLNRPEKRNPLSLEMMGEVLETLTSLPEETNVVVIGGSGSVFSAGHDLSQMVGAESDTLDRIFTTCTEMMEAVQAIRQPVVARVQGIASAAGCQLVAACDLAVASQEARFATPGVNIGLFCSTPMVPLTRAIGRKHAMQMLLTGQMIDATTAMNWGLINSVVPEERLDSTVDELVDAILNSSPKVVGLGKRAFYEQIDLDQHHAYMHTKGIMASNAQLEDAQEGMSAFLAKRKPVWRNK